MTRKISLTIRVFIPLALCALPGLSLADRPAPEDYIAEKPLLLEIRYCECQATNPESSPSKLLPGFLDESKVLKVGVSAEDKGFVASREFSLGYDINMVDDPSGQLQFNYIGTYATSQGKNTGQATLVLEQGEWSNLFGSHHQQGTESQPMSVMVRLVPADGS